MFPSFQIYANIIKTFKRQKHQPTGFLLTIAPTQLYKVLRISLREDLYSIKGLLVLLVTSQISSPAGDLTRLCYDVEEERRPDKADAGARCGAGGKLRIA